MVLACTVVLISAGVISIIASMVADYPYIEGLILTYSYSGEPVFLSWEYFGRVVFRARVLGAALMAAGAALWWNRRTLVDIVSQWCSKHGNSGIFRDPVFYVTAALYLVLAGYFLNQPMHPDEARTVNAYALRPFPVAWADTTAPNNHVLHTLAVKASISLFGLHEVSARLPAYLAGLAILIGGYLLALELFGHRRYARAYSALLATGGPVIVFGSMGRGYTMMTAAMLFMFWAAAGLLRDSKDARRWMVYGVAVIVGMATLKLMIMPVLAAFSLMGLNAMWNRDRRARVLFKDTLLLHVLVGLAVFVFYAPSIVMVERTMLTDQPAVASVGHWPAAFAQSLASIGHLFIYGSYAPVWILLVACFAYFCLAEYRRASFAIVVLTVFWTVLPLAVFRYLPYERIMFHVYVLWLLGAVGGMYGLVSRMERNPAMGRMGAVTVVALMLMANAHGILNQSENGILMPEYYLSDAPDIVRFIKNDLREDDLVVCRSPSASSLIFYFNRYGVNHRIYDVMEYRPEVQREDIGRRLVLIRRDQQHLTAQNTTITAHDDIAYKLEETITFPRSSVEMYRIVMHCSDEEKEDSLSPSGERVGVRGRQYPCRS